MPVTVACAALVAGTGVKVGAMVVAAGPTVGIVVAGAVGIVVGAAVGSEAHAILESTVPAPAAPNPQASSFCMNSRRLMSSIRYLLFPGRMPL